MDSLFEDKRNRRQKVHLKRDEEDQAKTYVPQAVVEEPTQLPKRKRASAQFSKTGTLR